MSSKNKTLIVVAGPTAIGKTELAIKLANFFSTEILSADSRQFFKEMSIGTAKPTQEQLQRATHHFVDFLPVTQFFSAGDFEQEALKTLELLFEKHNVVILVGGSGLYIRALCEGFDRFPAIDPSYRETLNKALEELGAAPLLAELKEKDPEYFQEIDQANPQRIVRALEVCRATGQKFSSFRSKQNHRRNFDVIKIGLDMPREKLYANINQRVHEMMEQGLLDEVKSLYGQRNLNALQTVGYSELFDFLDNKISLDQAVELIKQNTRRYAKRQLTWFRKEPGLVWFSPTQYQEILAFIQVKLGTKT